MKPETCYIDFLLEEMHFYFSTRRTVAVYYSSLSCFVVWAIGPVNIVVAEEKGRQIEQLVVITVSA